MRGFLCGAVLAPTVAPAADTGLTAAALRFRNAQQDRALAPKASRAELQVRFGACEVAQANDDPEWYFRVRDFLYKLP